MIFGEPLTFNKILQSLTTIEEETNNCGSVKILIYPDFSSFHRRSRIRDCYKDCHALALAGLFKDWGSLSPVLTSNAHQALYRKT
jgi:hypothetical protein